MARRRSRRRKPNPAPRVVAPPPTKPKLRVRADHTIRNLPKKSLPELVRIWRNALSLQDDPDQASEVRKLINAIGREWTRRKLTYDPDQYFKWPSTEAPGGSGGLSAQGWPSEGLLTFMEYHVGRTNGVSPPLRRAILSEVFRGELPPIVSPRYMAEWSNPTSAGRLRKLAESIASFTRNAKRRHNPLLDDAVQDWEEDLQFLFDEFYVGYFHFMWPTTAV